MGAKMNGKCLEVVQNTNYRNEDQFWRLLASNFQPSNIRSDSLRFPLYTLSLHDALLIYSFDVIFEGIDQKSVV